MSGVFTADPRVVPEARRLRRVSFEEMLEMCAAGCPKPAMRSVEFARNHGVRLHVRSAFTWEPGTWIEEEDPEVEQAMVSAVVSDSSEAKLTVTGVPDQPGIAARLFRALADRSINVDMIEQNVSVAGTTDISFTVPHADLATAAEVSRALQPEIGGPRGHGRPGHRHRVDHRGRHEDPSRSVGDHVRGPGPGGHQHRDDLDLLHPAHLRGARRVWRRRPWWRSTGRSSWRVSRC